MWACKLLTWDARRAGGLGTSPGGGSGGREGGGGGEEEGKQREIHLLQRVFISAVSQEENRKCMSVFYKLIFVTVIAGQSILLASLCSLPFLFLCFTTWAELHTDHRLDSINKQKSTVSLLHYLPLTALNCSNFSHFNN